METSIESTGDSARTTPVLFVGYGTLLYRVSLGQTLGDDVAAGKTMRPVIVNGYRRLFNLRPDHYESSATLSEAGIENGAMNVEPAPGSSFNGLAFDLTTDELARLDERERYYVRTEAVVHDFETGDELGIGCFYAAAPGAQWLEFETAQLMPLWRDIVWGRTGAWAISDEFGEYFDRTTYLADAKTLVVDRYRDLLTDPKPHP